MIPTFTTRLVVAFGVCIRRVFPRSESSLDSAFFFFLLLLGIAILLEVCSAINIELMTSCGEYCEGQSGARTVHTEIWNIELEAKL